ncbi:hypothetical protein AAF712_013130 [Marasmius tenuissimus]|uniref:Uncharacterized protein n=1 Tax=Marasmius tenuissimus TaxID=585030 RepID=A0ABR2ZET1_9AGAR
MAVNNDDMGGSKSRIQGNASEDVKRRLGNPSTLFMTKDRDGSYKSLGYSMEIFRRLEVTEISFEKHPEEPSKRFSRVVCELDVEPDMANNEEHLHGACSAYLVDMCTNIVILAYQLSTKKEGPSVSKSINTLYHSPALLYVLSPFVMFSQSTPLIHFDNHNHQRRPAPNRQHNVSSR